MSQDRLKPPTDKEAYASVNANLQHRLCNFEDWDFNGQTANRIASRCGCSQVHCRSHGSRSHERWCTLPKWIPLKLQMITKVSLPNVLERQQPWRRWSQNIQISRRIFTESKWKSINHHLEMFAGKLYSSWFSTSACGSLKSTEVYGVWSFFFWKLMKAMKMDEAAAMKGSLQTLKALVLTSS